MWVKEVGGAKAGRATSAGGLRPYKMPLLPTCLPMFRAWFSLVEANMLFLVPLCVAVARAGAGAAAGRGRVGARVLPAVQECTAGLPQGTRSTA